MGTTVSQSLVASAKRALENEKPPDSIEWSRFAPFDLLGQRGFSFSIFLIFCQYQDPGE